MSSVRACIALAALICAFPVIAAERVRSIGAKPGADGYVFQQKEYSRLSIRIDVNEHRTRQALRDEYLRETGTPDSLLLAFSRTAKDGTCVIHIMDPAVAQEPEVIGHEIEHCLHGDFHPRQENAR